MCPITFTVGRTARPLEDFLAEPALKKARAYRHDRFSTRPSPNRSSPSPHEPAP